MAQQFSGIRDFVAAVTGGDAIEQEGYDAGRERLIKQRSQQAQLDKRLEDAALAKDINVQRGNFLQSIPDLQQRGAAGANSGAAANWLNAQKAQQEGEKTDVLKRLIGSVYGAIDAGKPIPSEELNALNAILSGKLLGPGNVQTEDQASALIDKNQTASDFNVARTEAVDDKLPEQLLALQALTGQRNAAATKSATADATKPIALENPSDEQRNLLYGPDTEEPGRFYGTNTVPGEDLFPAFEAWRTQQAIAGNDVGDGGVAVQKFLESQNGVASVPPVPVAGAGEAPAPIASPAAPEDVDAWIARAQQALKDSPERYDEIIADLKARGIEVE